MSELSKEQCEEIRARAERAYLTDADMRAFDTHAKKDIRALLAAIARLNALLAEARIEVGLLAAMVPARAFSKKSDAEYIEAMGERARATLAKLGA